MARSGIEVGLGVIMWTLILIFYQETNGSTQSEAVLYSRLEVDKILLISLKWMNICVRNFRSGMDERVL